MKIRTVKIFRYDLPLRFPLTLKNHPLRTRSGLILRLEDCHGATAYGEAAPLPGFSVERLDDVQEEAIRVARSITGCTIPQELVPLSDRFERWLYAHNLSPSLNCALQAAVMDLLARDAGRSLSRFWNQDAPHVIPINALLPAEQGDPIETATQLHAAGYRTLKIKVGRGDMPREAATIRAIHDALAGDITLRLDANRAWDLDTATQFAGLIHDCPVEYIEEPLADPSQLVRFSSQTGIPVALDETVIECGLDDLERWRGVRAVVLKPMLLGGFEIAIWMARRAVNLGMTPVVSSTFESGVGLLALAHFAAALDQPGVAAGLDTHRWLAHDLLEDPLDMTRGSLDLEKYGHPLLRLDALHEVAYD